MKILIVACALFSMGLYGVLTRRDIVAVLASIEVMMGGALTLLVGLSTTGITQTAERTEGVALLVLTLAAAEAAVGLALLVLVAKQRGTTRIDELTEVKG